MCDSSENINDYTSVPVTYLNTTNSSNTITYNSTENAWELKGSGRYRSGRLIPNTHNLNNVRVLIDFKLNQAHNYCQLGLIAYENSTTFNGVNAMNNQIRTENTSAHNYIHQRSFNDKYYTLELIKNGNTLTGNVYDGDTLLGTIGDETISLNSWDFVFFIWTEGGSNYITWIKNIQVIEL